MTVDTHESACWIQNGQRILCLTFDCMDRARSPAQISQNCVKMMTLFVSPSQLHAHPTHTLLALTS